MCLPDVVRRIVGTNELSPLKNPMAGTAEAIGEALRDIREKAHLGLITVFGREGDVPGHKPIDPLGAIAKDHWADHRLDYMEFLQDNRGKTQTWDNRPVYFDIWFDRTEIYATWPSRRRRIEWTMRPPFVRLSAPA
jgi:hypothetical protein